MATRLTRRPGIGRFVAGGATALLLTASLTACAAASGQGTHAAGTVTGTFVREGGPIGPGGKQPPVVRLSGSIEFAEHGRRAITVPAGRKGTFSAELPAGTYAVSGRSPSIVQVAANGASREIRCSMPLSVQVRAGHTTKITLVCAVP
jgi:hypothetical protein